MMDSRTKNWIKIKNLQDDEFVICGYILKDKGVISLVLGQYRGQKMVYKGHVTLGVSSEAFAKISNQSKTSPPYNPPKGNEEAIWIRPNLVCTVKYMMPVSYTHLDVYKRQQIIRLEMLVMHTLSEQLIITISIFGMCNKTHG